MGPAAFLWCENGDWYQCASVQLIVGSVRPILLTLLGGSLLLLVIASVNVSSLMLVRSEGRRREIAVRGAIGATHGRVLRQFVTEGLLLSTAGMLAGVAIALILKELLTQLVPKQVVNSVPSLELAGLNSHTLAAWDIPTLGGVALLMGVASLAASFVPARRAACANPTDALRAE